MIAQSFTEIAITVAEKLRLGDELTTELVDSLLLQLNEICEAYQGKYSIPKSLAFDLLNLHDAFEGSLNYYSEDKRVYIAKVNSEVSCLIEKLLLEDEC